MKLDQKQKDLLSSLQVRWIAELEQDKELSPPTVKWTLLDLFLLYKLTSSLLTSMDIGIAEYDDFKKSCDSTYSLSKMMAAIHRKPWTLSGE